MTDNVMDKILGMTYNSELLSRATKLGLRIVNVSWEDTARDKYSSLGPNISDMTLQAIDFEFGGANLMPLLRYPNFSDLSADIPIHLLKVKVGNEIGSDLEVIPLADYLMNIQSYLSDGSTLGEGSSSLMCERDTHILVSAQACFLPIQDGKIEFNPVIYNYQSRADSPAVLCIMVSPEGTSATILNNRDDKGSWGQNVYYNLAGQKTRLTGERLSEYKTREAARLAEEKGISLEEASLAIEVASDLNMLMMIQVPLVQSSVTDIYSYGFESYGVLNSAAKGITARGVSDVEDVVISHGEPLGKHLELGGYKIERDTKYPIRLTVQFYKATSNGIVSDEDLENILASLHSVYNDATFVGSLVTGEVLEGVGDRTTEPVLSEQVLGVPTNVETVVNKFI